jgi:hypothetical protein
MLDGSAGSTPGSVGGAAGVGEFRLKLEHAPRNKDKAAMVDRLAIQRAHPKLNMVFPRTGSWPHPPQPILKPLAEQQ